jgi:nicotinate-nucleotide adenylyltransferase
MAALAARLDSARGIADGRRIVATDIEARLGTRYTVETLRLLRLRFPRVDFVWLMGADNLVQLPRWRRWEEIVAQVTFAVLPRPTYNHRALASHAAHRLAPRRLPVHAAASLAGRVPPRWVFLPVAQHAASATAIRLGLTGVQHHRPQAARPAH